ncbi:major facilitator superfamily domain-containing protein [Pseudomassariella vexata]|uniref:Major facilitator superfamily domain-containing protein n=1 Tax=Pseudomassariella vexata TaxID=1141098 RepID=A0A1Y2DV98_9PEZI|nr:major facilitator superfamily domain-containing protein [Pseudomassariella vexata]ORY63056.1 major facilitator superfamily domain-containing protein [Pseudomassariella vexata]
MTESTPARRWYDWYSPDDSPEERKLILKLDLLIVPYAFILYWIKYMDQTNINNAYVSGMSEDLGFNGNQLVQFQTIFVVGNVVGLLPFIYLFPRVPMHILVPTLDLGWGIFTLLQYRAQSYGDIMAYRFLVSLFEVRAKPTYFLSLSIHIITKYWYLPSGELLPRAHFVLGSWYRSDEIGRRGGTFYVGLTLGTLTASLLQAAATTHLDGPNRLVITESELALTRSRLEKAGARKLVKTPFSLHLLRRLFTNWRFYVLVLWDVFFFNTSANTAAFLLWIKSLHRYEVATMNNLAAISPALGIFFVLLINFSADLWIGRPGAITLASALNFTGLTILAIWNVPEPAKWFAFSLGYSAVAVSSVLYGWANVLLRDNDEERALTLVLMTAIATSTTAWVPLFTYPTVEAPRFPRGYVYSATMVVCLVIMTQLVRVLFDGYGKRRIEVEESASIERVDDETASVPSHQGLNPKDS